jgi:predicted transposase YbfD/YdcC
VRELPELPTKRKLPGHDTFRRVLSALNPKAFSAALFKLTPGLHEAVRGELFVIGSIRVESGAPQKRATRLFISSLLPKADHLATIVRSHWTTENRQHWSLDVSFGEDAKRACDKTDLPTSPH